MSLIRSLGWFALFVASTFFFIVIFEHGFSNIVENSKLTIEDLKKVAGLADKKPAQPGS